MRTHALLFGGLLSSFLLSSTGANAFFWLLYPGARQPAAVQQPTYRYEPGSQSYGNSMYYGGGQG